MHNVLVSQLLDLPLGFCLRTMNTRTGDKSPNMYILASYRVYSKERGQQKGYRILLKD